MYIRSAQKIDLAHRAPTTARLLKIRIEIEPPTGAVLIYTPGKADPVRFNGPACTGDVPLAGQFIYVQAVAGATKWSIYYLGYGAQK
jgi:hypothetical protein